MILKNGSKDNQLVNLLTIITVAFVLFVTFKSLSIPLILLLTIQTAVWINLSVPYFTDSSLVYVGYLLISIIQLAATVDYAILLTDAYKEYRKEMTALQAIMKTIDEKCLPLEFPLPFYPVLDLSYGLPLQTQLLHRLVYC